jgi:KDO2-lipid IV(A) lauroyltransferase
MPLGTLLQFMLPRWVTVRIARVVGLLSWRLNRKARERFTANCRHILGPDTPDAVIRQQVRRLFVNLVTNYLDLLRVPVIKHRLAGIADFDSREMDRLVGLGRGVVLVTGHFGNWDLAGAFIGARGYAISAVVEPVPGGWAETFNRYRSATRLEAIPIPDHAGIRSALERKRVLALVADRDLTGRGEILPCFDSFRSFPRGPAAYSLRYGAPVAIGYFVFQGEPGRPPYHAHVEHLEFSPTGDMDADVPALTRKIAEALTEYMSRFPEQWLVQRAGWMDGK